VLFSRHNVDPTNLPSSNPDNPERHLMLIKLELGCASDFSLSQLRKFKVGSQKPDSYFLGSMKIHG
jgi:hypothetical protein